jgi:hypothetical protein
MVCAASAPSGQDAVLESHAGAVPVADGLQEVCPRGQREPKRAVCTTVGSAYVGSNPTPITTCENGPLAAETRLWGPFLLCPAMCRSVSLRVDVSRCPRTHSGRRPGRQDGRCAPSAVSRTATDMVRGGAHSGFACSAEPGVRLGTRVPRLAGVPGGQWGLAFPICCQRWRLGG